MGSSTPHRSGTESEGRPSSTTPPCRGADQHLTGGTAGRHRWRRCRMPPPPGGIGAHAGVVAPTPPGTPAARQTNTRVRETPEQIPKYGIPAGLSSDVRLALGSPRASGGGYYAHAVPPLRPTAMSGSPRKNLRRADEALRQALGTVERYPEARAELVAALGEGRFTALLQAAAVIQEAVEVLDAPGGTD